ncbi:hypothetical protein [Actinocatenispora rupis]|nr:hypothetical protein [Actinocatenispora rupis]
MRQPSHFGSYTHRPAHEVGAGNSFTGTATATSTGTANALHPRTVQ